MKNFFEINRALVAKKKIFSIFAAVLFAASMNAQTLPFGEGSTGDQTYGDAQFSMTVAGWNGNHSATSGRYFGTAESNAKVTGMIASGDGAIGTETRTWSITSTYSGTLELYVISASSNERHITVGDVTKDTEKGHDDVNNRDFYSVLSFDISYGVTELKSNGSIYLYKVIFTSNGESAPTPRDTVAAYVQGVIEGNFAVTSTDDKAALEYTTKYNKNKTSCTAMTFTTSITATKDTLTDHYCMITPAEGTFKAGDIVSFQPFTVMDSAGYAGTKYGNIRMLGGGQVGEAYKATKLYETASSATDKSDVTDGHEQAGDVMVHTYTLTADCDALFIGRTGNTRVNVLSFVVTRAKADEPTAIESIETPAPKAVKTIENGRIVIIRNNERFDVTGRRW